MRIRIALSLLTIVLFTGCVAKKIATAPVRLYHFAYCDKMADDGKHCARWATPCGALVCKGDAVAVQL